MRIGRANDIRMALIYHYYRNITVFIIYAALGMKEPLQKTLIFQIHERPYGIRMENESAVSRTKNSRLRL